MGLGKILARLNPIAAASDAASQEVEEKTNLFILTAIKALATASPEIGDLLSGDKVRVAYTITGEVVLQLKQEGEK